MSGGIWAELGIAPTGDIDAIRRAYSTKLKTIDEETDRDAFIALRAAFDQARMHARRAPAAVAAAPPPPPPSPAADEAPVEPQPAPSQLDEDAMRLQRLVFGDRPREEIFEDVRAITERMLQSPDLEHVGRRNAVESWMANTIVRGIPRTNAMLDLVILHFGWVETMRQWNCPLVIRQVMERYEDVVFFDRHVRAPTASYHKAYRLLQAPPDGGRLRWRPAERQEAVAFLAKISTQRRSLQAEFPREALTAWRTYLHARDQSRLGQLRQRYRALQEKWKRTLVWLRSNFWRWVATLYLAPFVPGLLIWPISHEVGSVLLGIAWMWAALLSWVLVVQGVRWVGRKLF
ncbi:hypothetical protein [Sphingomonas oryzagri]|uniref:J domain-containing protein n=1 Tax=Sphingomonas oryzagri TaxID=3042314 RepID=A0ABT6N470_9SPHN|nr:hypothetical protein [Sphingomonas oryzagri]MDH7640103.1 hypothetical protein [Sphingomonas oryzagri]